PGFQVGLDGYAHRGCNSRSPRNVQEYRAGNGAFYIDRDIITGSVEVVAQVSGNSKKTASNGACAEGANGCIVRAPRPPSGRSGAPHASDTGFCDFHRWVICDSPGRGG